VNAAPTARWWNGLVLGHWLGSDVPAIVDDDGTVTGHELLQLAAGASAWFDELGFVAGDAIPALMDETRTAIAMVVGGAMSRRPLAPLGTKLAPDDLVHAVAGLGARVLFVSPERRELGEQVAAGAGARLVVVDRPLTPAEPLAGDCAPDDTVVLGHHRAAEADPSHPATARRSGGGVPGGDGNRPW
jgi:acyl-coenzyme A synthetase/AMP-(fatty) acid ligase